MNKNLSKFIILCLCIFVTSKIFALNTKTIFHGNPNINKIDISIKTSNLFKDAPKPTIRIIDYKSIDLATDKIYSSYQIKLIQTTSKLTQYRTQEFANLKQKYSVIPIPEIYGQGVGYGGMFSIIYQKSEPKNRGYFIKYRWTKIWNIKGHLFPLNVGNKVSFNYQDQQTSRRNYHGKANTIHTGKIVYQVINQFKGYKNAYTFVPGEIYVIKFSRSSRLDAKLQTQNIYYFSKKLGWYVFANYYKYGRVVAEYDLSRYS